MSDHAHPHSEEPWRFNLHISALRASGLKIRHKFAEKVRCKVTIERSDSAAQDRTDKVFKTPWVKIGGEDVYWKLDEQYTLNLYYNKQATVRIREWLESHYIIFDCYCKHDSKAHKKSRGDSFGFLKVSLYDCVTGCANHNLPLLNSHHEPQGRLFFSVVAEQDAQVSVMFKSLKFKSLPPVNTSMVQGLDPYVKYQYSKYWPLVEKGKVKAVYSNIQHRTVDPAWEDLPVLRFRSSIKEMLGNSLVVHCLHASEAGPHVVVARANLLFRTLVDHGGVFRERDHITFNGALKVSNARIMGELTIAGLPHYAQCKGVNVETKPVHTEEGLVDAQMLLPWLIPPKIPFVSSDGSGSKPKARHLDDSTKVSTPEKQKLNVRNRSKSYGNAAEAVAQANEHRLKAEKKFVDDLIQFTPTPKKKTASRIVSSSSAAAGSDESHEASAEDDDDRILEEVAEMTGIAELMRYEEAATETAVREAHLGSPLQPIDLFGQQIDESSGGPASSISFDPHPDSPSSATPTPQKDSFNPFA